MTFHIMRLLDMLTRKILQLQMGTKIFHMNAYRRVNTFCSQFYELSLEPNWG